MSTMQQGLDEILTKVGAVSDIRAAITPPEQLNVFPIAVCYPQQGEWRIESPGERRSVFDAVLEVHIARGDLPRTYTAAMNYSDSVVNAILLPFAPDATRYTHIDAIGSIRWVFGPLGWGTDGTTVDTFGWRFTIVGIKMRELLA